MSFNISNTFTACMSEIRGTVDLMSFGPRQLTAYKKFMKTGVIKGYSAPAVVAQTMREVQGLPSLRFGRYDRLIGLSIPSDHPVWEEFTIGLARYRLMHPEHLQKQWMQRLFDEVKALIARRDSCFRVSCAAMVLKYADIVRSKISFGEAVMPEGRYAEMVLYRDSKEFI